MHEMWNERAGGRRGEKWVLNQCQEIKTHAEEKTGERENNGGGEDREAETDSSDKRLTPAVYSAEFLGTWYLARTHRRQTRVGSGSAFPTEPRERELLRSPQQQKKKTHIPVPKSQPLSAPPGEHSNRTLRAQVSNEFH